ncbi:50S ribosomal protein L13 [Ignicoccus pacificus DSM 13166]|uniref:50S ribosomal protein L13e n=1 Tax=Ignicoccus pacificus DSM 13166 TaxID=940294 RepID=A0A977PJC1_9CREN|nr:50S ribosomal protein L13 [Ignicoccus pacificus DSM 13166]
MEERPVAKVLTPILRKDAGKKPRLKVGRGFSKAELEEVGLTFKQALKMGIPIDKRRKTKHEWNVETLRKWLEKHNEKA